MTKRRSLPKVLDSTSSWSSVSWEYHTGFGSTSWENVQEGWTCQLCNIFSSFTLGSALMYHLQRDHSAVGARRKKLGFKKWKIIIDLVRPVSPISPAILSHESSPLPELVPSVIDDTSSIEEEVIIEEDLRVLTTTTHMGDKVEARRYRVGGTKCYDLAMQEMPMPLRGIAAKTFECRENDMCLFTKCSDEEKAMAIIWGRWICQYRLDFIKQPLQNAILFVDTHWDLIRRTAEFEGLIRWLMTMKFHHYFSQGQVAAISKRYQRHLP
ncbi:hypothetical protein M408DRAFT_326740 [Serendipita vermifera MAFF 305830]|uniref:Uncharacterized protein n=1 Tax=Serendipita vermifera MAFF 305830 TaxID=933852 RepID=A0A0C2X4N7_SERVB|nr:hypothetical protein M408DRAFT_326740 [Serendipita vermifera MAFF 305830]